LVIGAKHDAWAKLGKMGKDEAMSTYIKNLEKLSANWKDEAAKMGLKSKL